MHSIILQQPLNISRVISVTKSITRTVFLSLIGAIPTVIDRVTQLVAVDAAIVVTAETERSLTLDVHCG